MDKNYIDLEGCINLVTAIIYNAFEDALISDADIEDSANISIKLRKARDRQSAINFFKSQHFIDYCELIDLNPDYVQTLLRVEFKKRSKNHGRCPI